MDQSVSNHRDIAGMEFEQALNELQIIVKNLERGDVKLEEAVRFYERGILLKKHCETKLRQAQLKIEQIMLDEQGEPRDKQMVGAQQAANHQGAVSLKTAASKIEAERAAKTAAKPARPTSPSDDDIPF